MNITYPQFCLMYNEAKNCDDVDMYVAERGWQEWMNEFDDVSDITAILNLIYDLRFATVKDLRTALNYSQALFANTFNTSTRNVERWESGERKIEESKLNLMVYATLGILWKGYKDGRNIKE